MSPTLLRPRRRAAVLLPPVEGSAPSAPTGISLTTAPLVPTAITLATAPSPPTGVTMETGLVAPTNVGLLAAPKNLTATEVFAPDSPTGLDLTAAPASPTGVQLSAAPSEPTSVTVVSAPSSPTGVGLLGEPTNVVVIEGGATDPYFSDVVLLLQDSLTDESLQGQTVTALGGASFTTTNPKIGTHSLDIASSGHITTSAFPLGTGDYTLEMWFYQTASATQPFLYTGQAHTTAGSLWVTADIGGGGGLSVGVAGGGAVQQIKTQVVPALNQWNHFAVCRESGNTKIFLNGNLLISSAAHSGVNLPEAAPEFGNESSTNRRFPGYIDAIRVTKAARYTSNFTPTTSAFPS